jgi:hypothetical protein
LFSRYAALGELPVNAYRTILTVTEPHQVVVNDVPFPEGEQVEVIVVIAQKNNSDTASRLRQLLKDTQSLPQIQQLTDEEIQAEVAAHRSGR